MAEEEQEYSQDMSSVEKEIYTPGPNAVDVSPDQDKGILKEIMKPGTGTESPMKGDKVFVHYTGKLMDGTVFDSSRDRGIFFDFTLGKGHVIKAWDIGVATMKAGEVCMLTCNPDYAYGKNGSPPKIPPDATLVFEVELFNWELEDLSSSKDQGIRRSVIIEGEGNEMPNEDASVEIHVVGKYSGNVFDERDVKFQLGEGCQHGIVEGLEVAVKNFKKGECSRIIISHKYAFGAAGKPEFNIPPNSEVEYEVTLKSFEKAKESWEMDGPEKVEQSEIVKTRGTKFFKEGQYEKALKQYKKIITYLQYETSLEGPLEEQKKALLLAGHLNIVACNLKLSDPHKAIENSEKALAMEPNNAKGLFRRGQAKLILKDYDSAKADFQQVIRVDPSNKAAQKQVLVCNELMKQQLAQEKELYKNMFQKLAKYSTSKEEKIDNGDENSPDEDAVPEPSTEKLDIGDGNQAKEEAVKA